MFGSSPYWVQRGVFINFGKPGSGSVGQTHSVSIEEIAQRAFTITFPSEAILGIFIPLVLSERASVCRLFGV